MRRRQFVASAAVITTTAIAGCSSGGGGGIGSGPKSVANSYLEAYFNGNYEEARGYTTGVARAGISEQDVGEAAARETAIGDTVKNEQSDDEAVVSIVITAETALGEATQTVDLLLVNTSGWKVSHSRTGFEGESKPAEAGAFDATLDGPVDTAFAYIRQDGLVGTDDSGSDYLVDGTEAFRGYLRPDSDTTITLVDHSQSDGSAEVVIDAIDTINPVQFTFSLTQSSGEWLINGIETGSYESGKYDE